MNGLSKAGDLDGPPLRIMGMAARGGIRAPVAARRYFTVVSILRAAIFHRSIDITY